VNSTVLSYRPVIVSAVGGILSPPTYNSAVCQAVGNYSSSVREISSMSYSRTTSRLNHGTFSDCSVCKHVHNV